MMYFHNSAKRKPKAASKAARVMVKDRTPDAVLLDILDRITVQGASYDVAGAVHGMSRSAVAGVMMRIRRDTDAAEAVPAPRGQVLAYRPENRNGGMAARWWQAGLEARLPRRGVSGGVSA